LLLIRKYVLDLGEKIPIKIENACVNAAKTERACKPNFNGEQNIVLDANQSTYIPAGHKHRLENPTDTDLVMIEVQCGPYLGEDDIVRFEDTYGRT
jgi:hypothetical protein